MWPILYKILLHSIRISVKLIPKPTLLRTGVGPAISRNPARPLET